MAALLALAGCGGGPSSYYRALPDKKASIDSMGVIVDFTLIEGLMGDTSKIDLIENRRLGEALLTQCADSLTRGGYPVRRTALTSIGLLMKPAGAYRIVRSTATQHIDSQDLPLGSPPFFVDDEFMHDTLLMQLRTLYLSLLALSQRGERDSTPIPEAMPIGKELGCGTMAVILVGGFNTPVSKGIGKTTPNESNTMGIVTLQSVSQLSVMLFLIDAVNGKVLWDDKKYLTGGVIFPEKIFGAAGDLLEELP
jgi:hypothetical protein